MSRCDAYTSGFQSASAALAEAFDAFSTALDDFDPADYVIEAPTGTKWPPRGKAPPGLPIAPARGMTSVERVDQRTVKAGVCWRNPTSASMSIKLHSPRPGRPGGGNGKGGVQMATVVTREGVILSQPKLTDEQRAEGWCIFLRALLQTNPEALMGGQDAAEPCTSSE